eukprot:scaffold175697_cov36-Tisochrysis_lutea.AAC.2
MINTLSDHAPSGIFSGYKRATSREKREAAQVPRAKPTSARRAGWQNLTSSSERRTAPSLSLQHVRARVKSSERAHARARGSTLSLGLPHAQALPPTPRARRTPRRPVVR